MQTLYKETKNIYLMIKTRQAELETRYRKIKTLLKPLLVNELDLTGNSVKQ